MGKTTMQSILKPMPIKQHIILKNQLTELTLLASAIEDFAEKTGLDMQAIFKINLALDELVTNIVSYAYDDESLHQIEITLSYDAPIFTASLIDDGKAFDPTMTTEPDVDTSLEQRKVGGLGVHFVKTLMDKIDYNRHAQKNHVRLEKDFSITD